MKLSAPKFVTFVVSVILFVIGLAGTLLKVSALASFGVYALLLAWVILALAVMLNDL
jgi:NADH:ubiquinone oxidoreductase subunit K